MSLVVKKLILGYSWAFGPTGPSDPRGDSYPLMSSPIYPAIIAFGYLYLVFKAGPKFMENRPAFNLEKIMLLYNVVQIMVNAYMTYHASTEMVKLNWFCAPVDYTITPHNLFVYKVVYMYFITKVMDLLDTVFIIMRKKSEQATFLHIYHHFGMVIIGWGGTKYFAGGFAVHFGFINALVHTIMYFYYLLTVVKPEYKKSIWWKKHITELQLAQFIFIILIFGQVLFKECDFPKLSAYILVPQNIFMLCLFGDFYYKTYVKPNRGTVKAT